MDKTLDHYLEGLSGFLVVYMPLLPGSKRTFRAWDRYEELHEQRGESRIDLAYQWLREGYGLGYLLRNRLAAIDADKAETVQRVMDFEEDQIYLSFPKVYTPSGGIHALFVHPPSIDLSRLKNHICHPKEEGVAVPWDFKLGERTMLVAPGTLTPRGAYRPGIWLPPPVLDVRHLVPELEIYRDTPDFLRDTRPLRDRIMAAMSYLRYRAPVSVEGAGGRNTLRQVAQHLVGYHDIDVGLAFYLMTETKVGRTRSGAPVTYTAWNARCVDAEGNRRPWSDDTVLRALEDAMDEAPTYGVYLQEKARAKEQARWCSACFVEVLTHLPEPLSPIWIKAGALYGAFIEFSGVKPESYSKSELGVDVAMAIEQGRLPFVERGRTNAEGRIYLGLDLNTLRIAIDRYEQGQKAHTAAA